MNRGKREAEVGCRRGIGKEIALARAHYGVIGIIRFSMMHP